ncbi:MAG: ABC transporter permease [Phycisphaerae bacterium]|nr:ABC transporter permease [Phycisphaerae bacterium]
MWRASWPFARQSLAGRRGRTILLVIAVTLGSALVVATSCSLASVEASVEYGITRALGRTDARIIDRYSQEFDVATLERVRALPDVQSATARLFGSITLLHESPPASQDGEPERHRVTVGARGIDVPADERFREMELEVGTRPMKVDDVLLDPAASDALHAKVGDRLVIQRFGAPIELSVCGIYKRAKLGALQRPHVELSRERLAEATGLEGQATVIALILRDGDDVHAWCERHADVVEEPLVLEPAERVTTGLDRQVLASQLGFTLAASIAFLSCAFIVAVGLTTAVTEQQREMAIARCIGAARPQLFLAQLLVGGAIGTLGGLLGMPVGIGLAWLLVNHYREFLQGGFSVSLLGLGLALVGTVSAGLLGAAYPAWQASRVMPLEALRVRARPPQPSGLGICLALGTVLVAGQLLLLLVPDTQTRFWLYAIGGIAFLHIGYFLWAPLALWLVTRIAGGAVGTLFGLPAGLLVRSVRSMPYRLGFTAGALMVGGSIMVSTWSNGMSVLDEFRDRIRFADGFVMCSTGLSPEKQRIIEAMPGVLQSCPVGYLPVRLAAGETLGVDGLGPQNVVCVGFDLDRFLGLNRLDFIEGDPAHAVERLREGDAVLVAEQFLIARGLGLGTSIGLGGNAGDKRFEIVGVVSSAGLDIATQFFGLRQVYMEQAASCVFMDFDAVARHFGSRDAFIMQLVLDPSRGEDLDEELKQYVLEKVPGANYASGRMIRGTLDKVANTLLGVTAGVSFAALFLACFGVGNVVAAGIAARRHEFGVLRAIGGASSLPMRLVLGESVLVALSGALIGTALGLHLAKMGTLWHRDLAGIATSLSLPVGPIAIGWLAILGMTILASVPAAAALRRQSPRALLATRG